MDFSDVFESVFTDPVCSKLWLQWPMWGKQGYFNVSPLRKCMNMHQTHQLILCVYKDLFVLSPGTSRHVFTNLHNPDIYADTLSFLVFLLICKSCNLRLKLTEPTSKPAEKYQPKNTICFPFMCQDCTVLGGCENSCFEKII